MVPVCFNCLNSNSGECFMHHKQSYLTTTTYLATATSTMDKHSYHKDVFYIQVNFWPFKKKIRVCDECKDVSDRVKKSEWYIPKKEKIEIACYLGVVTILVLLFYFTVVK